MRERREEIGKGDGSERGSGKAGELPWCDASCIPPCNCLLIIGRRQVRGKRAGGRRRGKGREKPRVEEEHPITRRQGKRRRIRLEAVKRELACEWGVKKD